MIRIALIAAIAALSAAPALAERTCRMAIAGAKCAAPQTVTPFLSAGAPLPDGAELLLNPRYYGLPPVDGAWRYYVIGSYVYRVDSATLEIIERVNGGNSRLW